ncbi:hypothetical protein GQ600_16499 [Phytophthora cactorum]|nr:hypothetical protein GQ600_16499 [Phytophthora cactorum]
MGNICHAGPPALGADAKPRSKSKSRASTGSSKAAPTFGKDPTLKREDFIFSNIQTASFLAKLPGSINGQQFSSRTATTAISSCWTIARPCRSTPVSTAESSWAPARAASSCATANAAPSCAPCSSSALATARTCPCISTAPRQQFRQVKFSPWNNKWSEIFDFTPDHGGWKPLPMRPHESPLAEMMPEKENNGARSLWKMPSWTAEELGLSVDLRTHGRAGTALFPDNTVLAGKATEAAKSTAGSVTMEFQGPQCYQHVSDTLQDARFASEAAARNNIFVSKDTVTAL